MTKQEFMAFSLPYWLKCKCIYDDEILIEELNGVSCNCEQIQCDDYDGCHENVLPILHPLSDLTKEIEHKGEVFVPIEKIKEMGFNVGEDWILEGFTDIQNSAFEFVLKIIEWHFDLFGGINNGDAIDINTLEINPYKN